MVAEATGAIVMVDEHVPGQPSEFLRVRIFRDGGNLINFANLVSEALPGSNASG